MRNRFCYMFRDLCQLDKRGYNCTSGGNQERKKSAIKVAEKQMGRNIVFRMKSRLTGLNSQTGEASFGVAGMYGH